LASAGLLYGQIVLGALLTHAGWLQLHLVGALAVFVVVPLVTARLRRSGDPVAAPTARALLLLLIAQLVLGVGSLVARYAPEALGSAPLGLTLLVAHRVVAGLLLAAAVVLAVRTWGPRAEARALVELTEHPA
jgi:hypothetical protein